MSFLYTLLLLVIGLIVFFFLLGNVSLMNQRKSSTIRTPHIVSPSEETLIDADIDQVARDLNQDIDQNGSECQSAKKQIMKIVQFKRQKDHHLLDGLLPHLAPVDDTQPQAPVLENFEDYAPIDTPNNVPKDRGTVHLVPPGVAPLRPPEASNSFETLHQSEFDSERRSPWFEKQGKDDISRFFETHEFDRSFDQAQKQPIQCPSDWEQQTKQ